MAKSLSEVFYQSREVKFYSKVQNNSYVITWWITALHVLCLSVTASHGAYHSSIFVWYEKNNQSLKKKKLWNFELI